tara:strand:+ start:430 stop:579 length:150 start_codon:yes stop_codon:yes gene_type:complete
LLLRLWASGKQGRSGGAIGGGRGGRADDGEETVEGDNMGGVEPVCGRED